MGKQIFNIKGMMRDLDPAKASNQYAYEIRNLRITAQEDTTFLALTTEVGNLLYRIKDYNNDDFAIQGTIIGYCTLHNYLVLFTHENNKTPDKIYRLELVNSFDNKMYAKSLYVGNLGFGETGVNIEAIGIYENENLQKVYWIDNVHQPRFINIVADATTMHHWNDNSFDFSPRMLMQEDVEVKKANYSGVFNAGTVQYILTYYNKNGQQSASFYQSPINYISYENKGASPEDTVSNSFLIRVYNPDSYHFEYVRIYSVFRSSENGTPVCKRIADIKTSNTSTTQEYYSKYSNISASGQSSVAFVNAPLGNVNRLVILNSSNTEVPIEDFLQYRHGSTSFYKVSSSYAAYIISLATPTSAIKVQAATDECMDIWIAGNAMGINKGGESNLTKWSTVTLTEVPMQRTVNYIEYLDNGLSGTVVSYSEILFLGGSNIIPKAMAQKDQTLFFGNYSTTSVTNEFKSLIKAHSSVHFGYSKTPVDKGTIGSHYMYSNQLDKSAKDITGFKGGETYHFGIILQDFNGTWTDVIPIGKARNNFYPNDTLLCSDRFNPIKAYIYFDPIAQEALMDYMAIKVVRLNTLPSVVYQGVLAPTVFNNKREDNLPYCQSSWFFREVEHEEKSPIAHKPQNMHNGNIMEGGDSIESVGEIQGACPAILSYYHTNIELVDSDFFVDWNTLTLHSPDIEFSQATNINYRMRIVGITPITANRTSMSITYGAPYNPNAELRYTPLIHNNLDTDAFGIDLQTYCYYDGDPNNDSAVMYTYPIYPWHRNGSITAQGAPSGNDHWYALLDTKVMASLRESASTRYLGQLEFNVTKLSIYQDDDVPIRIEEDHNNFLYQGPKIYMGNMDTVLTHKASTDDRSKYFIYGMNSSSNITPVYEYAHEPVRMRYKSTKHGVFSLKSDEHIMYILPNIMAQDSAFSQDPALNQIIPKGTVKYATTTSYYNSSTGIVSNISDTSLLSRGDLIQVTGSGIYYITSILDANRAKVTGFDMNWVETHPGTLRTISVIPVNNYPIVGTTTKERFFVAVPTNQGTDIYHIDIDTYEGSDEDDHGEFVPFLVEVTFGSPVFDYTITTESTDQIQQQEYTIDNNDYSYLYIAEMFTDDDLSVSYENGSWFVASEPRRTGSACIEASIGDTYYQRYDCLKTYPYSTEDQNQVVEIFSFMCETRTNIDGRYDGNRGLIDNTLVHSTTFNQINKVYTQDDNFFTYNYLGDDYISVNDFPNQLIWTMNKTYGSTIDNWTQIIPTSTLDMNGALGEVRALKLWNDNLICFQDSGIAKIMYNERTTMSTEQGIPVEIANSGKVDGSHYISTSIGCKNKNSIQVTPESIYFVDSNKRDIYRWSQGLEAITKTKGFTTYMNDNSINMNDIKTFYDGKLKDVYFRITNGAGASRHTECLVFNEQLNEFTSFFDYDMDFMFNYNGALVSTASKSNTLWKQFSGDYLRYFNRMASANQPLYQEYLIQLVSAENPTEDKTFTGVEFRADVLEDNITLPYSQATDTKNYATDNILPFKTIRVWNEYQDTDEEQLIKMLRAGTNMAQKFRIWRAFIGRDTMDPVHKFNRIRSPWSRIELKGGGESMKTVIHDIAVIYV